MKNSIYKNKTLLCAIVFVLIFCTVFFAVQDIARFAFADSNDVSFDDSNVMDDLESSTVNGKPFDFIEYSFDETKSLQIVNFVEYCYSYKANMRGNYGIYIYIYNPKGLDIVENSGQNKIQMAVSWVKDDDGKYRADRYEKFNLKFCNKSEKANYKGLFYKFKVVDKEIDGKTMAQRVNSTERRYDVSGIELLTRGNTNATEYGVGGTYKFTGYAQGYGDSDESTLSCVVEDLETLKLEVHKTAYRTNVSSLGKGHYNEVNTVYFSVPDRIFKTYGNLQKIHAEWWEYKLKKSIVTANKDFADTAKQFTTTTLEYTNPYKPRDDMYSIYYGYSQDYAYNSHTYHYYDWGFNTGRYRYKQNDVEFMHYTYEYANIIPLVFYAPVSDIDEVFSFFFTSPNAGDVSQEEVAKAIYDYTNSDYGFVDCNGRQLSSALFENNVDSGRSMGYNDQTIDLQDTFNLDSYDSNHSWWDKLWDYGFSWPSTSGDYTNVPPIVELTDDILKGDESHIAEKYLVNKEDVFDLRTYYQVETLKGNHVILFRFANTDYFCMPSGMDNVFTGNDSDTYIAQQTVFFDFDIIDLTFNKKGVYTVIPAVSSPIDIINDITSPPSGLDWWKIVLMIVALILFVVLLAPILPYILNALIWLIKLPFKLISKVCTSFKKYRDKRKYDSAGVTKEDLALHKKDKEVKCVKKQKKKE